MSRKSCHNGLTGLIKGENGRLARFDGDSVCKHIAGKFGQYFFGKVFAAFRADAARA